MVDEIGRARRRVDVNRHERDGPQGGVSAAQRDYLRGGLNQPGGRLPLFDEYGGKIAPETIRSCIREGYCDVWFANPMKPDWLVCRLTDRGRDLFR